MKLIQKAKTDDEFRLCGYGPIIYGGKTGLSIRLRVDLPGPLRFGIFWHNRSKIELGFDCLSEILKALGNYSNQRFCNKCGQYYPALLTQDVQSENWSRLTVCHKCKPELFKIKETELSPDFQSHYAELKEFVSPNPSSTTQEEE